MLGAAVQNFLMNLQTFLDTRRTALAQVKVRYARFQSYSVLKE